eukprot:COSAG05_NODE_479_length_9424_cov_38.098552_5_plen_106_part_00
MMQESLGFHALKLLSPTTKFCLSFFKVLSLATKISTQLGVRHMRHLDTLIFRREFKPNRSTHSISCKCACAAWVPWRAARATDLARATPRPTGGDGDGPLADGGA